MRYPYHVICCLVLGHIGLVIMVSPECDPSLKDLNPQERYECLVTEMLDSSKYSALVRPVNNTNETLTVQFSVQLSQIIDIDEKNQVMKSNVWLQLYWNDYQLVWKDNSLYNDITVFRINPDYVWRPDVVLFNNADGNYEVSYRSNVLVYSTGAISWIPPAIYKSSCSIDVQFFPFDEQVCDMKFGSWTFLDNQLNYSFYNDVPHFDVSDYLVNGAWDIKSGEASMERMSIGHGNDHKAMIIFRLVLRRKTLFYTVNLIIPCVLISFVTLSVFILPADAGEKITLCISILLALVVFLLLISKILPPALTVPLISQYLLFTFIMNILAIVSTVIVINRNYRTPRTHQMPYWIRLLFLNYLPRVLLMKRPDHEERWQGLDGDQAKKNKKAIKPIGAKVHQRRSRDPDLTHTTNYAVAQRNTHNRNQPNVIDGGGEAFVDTHHPNCRLNTPLYTGETSLEETSFINTNMSPELFRAAESLKFIHKHLKKDDDYHTEIDDWRYVARVIDRMLLIVFLIVTIGGTIGIFFKAPHIFQSVDQDELLRRYNRKWADALSQQ